MIYNSTSTCHLGVTRLSVRVVWSLWSAPLWYTWPDTSLLPLLLGCMPKSAQRGLFTVNPSFAFSAWCFSTVGKKERRDWSLTHYSGHWEEQHGDKESVYLPWLLTLTLSLSFRSLSCAEYVEKVSYSKLQTLLTEALTMMWVLWWLRGLMMHMCSTADVLGLIWAGACHPAPKL